MGVLVVRLRIRQSRSLKDRRSVVRGLVDRLRSRVGASVAEAREPSDHQSAKIALAVVCSSAGLAREKLEQAQRIVFDVHEAEILDYSSEIL